MVRIKEKRDTMYVEIMPYYSLTDYDVENEFINRIRKFEKLNE